jgi:hypothetical protein
MWGQNWGTMIWGTTVPAVPALGFWGAVFLGAILGAVGVLCLKGARPRTVALVVFGLALVAPVIARATLPFTFANGTVADATQVNANFSAATVVTVGSVHYSVGATKYCGQTPTHDGNLGGYSGAKHLCETACSSTTAHMCTSEELTRTSQLGVTIAIGVLGGWYATGINENYSGNPVNDCVGWTSNAIGNNGPSWAPGLPQNNNCGATNAVPVLCCD